MARISINCRARGPRSSTAPASASHHPAARPGAIATGATGATAPAVPPGPRRWSFIKSLHPAMLLLLVLLLLASCATEKNEPWKRRKPKWWEMEMDPDDRAFYHDYFFSH